MKTVILVTAIIMYSFFRMFVSAEALSDSIGNNMHSQVVVMEEISK